MKRQLRLAELKAAKSTIEDQIQTIEESLRRSSFKRQRKALRKRLAKDPILLKAHMMLKQMENRLYGLEHVFNNWGFYHPKPPLPALSMQGIKELLK